MNIVVHSKGITLLDEEKLYAEERASELLHRSNNADVKEDVLVKIEIDKEGGISNNKEQFFCSVTVDLPGKVLRAEAHSGGVYSSVDDAMDNMRRQLKKEKEKHIHL